jgi:DnaK suppressor protein
MNKARLKRYKSILSEQLALLLHHNDETVVQMEDAALGHSDPNDRASLEADRNFDLRLRDRDRKLIRKIKDALVRIDEGTFGICEDCGQPIEDARLRARPVTSQCIECKEDQERRERREKSLATQRRAVARVRR